MNILNRQSGIKQMERKTRLELATPTLARWCSTTELFPQYGAETRLELATPTLAKVVLYH